MRLRSLLFVPADRPERFAKAAASGADAIILDLEDSVSLANKAAGRAAVTEHLGARHDEVMRIVRINPLTAGMLDEDLAAARGAAALMLPKAEGAESVAALRTAWGADCPPILPIAAETTRGVFCFGSYADAPGLLGLTWGAEDLPAAIGAETAREADGGYTDPYRLTRSLTLFAAHAAGVAAIETVFPGIADLNGLIRYAARGARDGFTGMMAIHPTQVAPINAAFTPSAAAIEKAQRIVDAFAAQPDAGALQLDGAMIDAPHLKQAQRLLARACSDVD